VLCFVILHAPARAAYRSLRAVWAFKASIASAVGLGERTVYRALDELAAAGWVEVLEQDRRNRSGRFHSARVVLTDLALSALGLLTPRRQARSAKLAYGSKGVIPSTKDQQDQPFQEQPAGGGAPEDKSKADKPKATATPGALPPDVAWLCKLGMSNSQVFGLMKVYSSAGKRLGVAAEALRRHLDGKPPRDAFAYLKAMASKDLDFGRVVEMQRQDAQALQAEQASRDLLSRLQGCRKLRRVSDGRVLSVSAGCVLMPDGGVLPLNGRLADRVLEGAWEIVE
jgi:DNA-binding transcriptional ArsR family regulator